MTGYIFSSSEAKRVADTVRSNEGEVQRRLPPRPKRYVSHGGGGVSGGDSGGGGSSPSDSCCSTTYSIGSVDSNSLEWATDYLITGAAAPLADITVTDQGSDTWESDTIDVTCTVDESEETDEYTATMVVSGGGVGGVPAGGIVLTIAMTLGGDSGDAICCDSLATGFVHKYTNTKPVANPLAGFKLKPMQTGTVGQNCENVVCELCVVPQESFTDCSYVPTASFYEVEFNNDGTGPYASHNGGKYTLDFRNFENEDCCEWENRVDGTFALYGTARCLGETGSFVRSEAMGIKRLEWYRYEDAEKTSRLTSIVSAGIPTDLGFEQGLLVSFRLIKPVGGGATLYEAEFPLNSYGDLSTTEILTEAFTLVDLDSPDFSGDSAPSIKNITPLIIV